MNRKSFSVAHKLAVVVNWYGKMYTFYRPSVDSYGEPTGQDVEVQRIQCVYHSSEHNFVELLGTEASYIKSKINRGLLCQHQDVNIKQKDKVYINGTKYLVTACETILYCDEPVGIEISLEEVVHGDEQ